MEIKVLKYLRKIQADVSDYGNECFKSGRKSIQRRCNKKVRSIERDDRKVGPYYCKFREVFKKGRR